MVFNYVYVSGICVEVDEVFMYDCGVFIYMCVKMYVRSVCDMNICRDYVIDYFWEFVDVIDC